MNYQELKTKTALNPLKRKGLPYKFDLNIYQGCSHGCKYCYGSSNQKYLGNNLFSSEISVKSNIAQILDQELSSSTWKGDIINIGGVCDSYQAAEKQFMIMRSVLEVLIRHKNPVIISTKSDLILRDLDLINELGQQAYVNIAACITTVDDEMSRSIEPGASLPHSRLNVLREFSRSTAFTGFHFMPILPYLADDEPVLEEMVKWAASAEVDYMLTGVLYLTGGIKKKFFSFLEEEYPELLGDYQRLYPRGGADPEYKAGVHKFLGQMRKKYRVNNNYSQFLPSKN